MASRRVPRARRQQDIDSVSNMSGETARPGLSQDESAFESLSEQPWRPVPEIPLPTNDGTSYADFSDANIELTVPGSQEVRVMLAIDYGTTHTGLAFMHQTTERQPLFPNDLHVHQDWEGGNTGRKIPSAISYSKTLHGCKQWGNDIDEQHSRVLQWTKLELHPRKPLEELRALKDSLSGLRLLEALQQNEQAGIDNDIPLHITRSPARIVEEFLSRVAREYYLHMRRESPNAIGEGIVPLDMVVTHPAEWPYEAINKTYRAVTAAFDKLMFPTRRNIYLVPEPEACAVFTVQDMIAFPAGNQTLVPGDCFVVCDAGGGTVDLVTYRFNKLEPLEMEKIGTISGGYCGATFIDQAFIKWIESRTNGIGITSKDVGTGGHFVLEPKGTTILKKFEVMKRKFSGTEANTLTLPSNVQLDASVTNGVPGLLPISAEDMRSFFEFSITETIDLLSRHFIETDVTGGRILHIFMSGGMSQNDYVFNRVKKWAKTHNGEISVQRPTDGWTAVVQGAVLSGMGIGANNAVLAQPCPRHFGIMGAEVINPRKHRDPSIKIIQDVVHGGNVTLNQITWLIHKNDLVLPDQPIIATCQMACTYYQDHIANGSITHVIFCATDTDNPPSHSLSKDNNEIAALEIRIDKIPRSACVTITTPGGTAYIEAKMTVKMTVHYSGKFDVNVMCDEQTMASYPEGKHNPFC
ncbi:hypothetical protein B0H63DRAFT_140781 [Podospora didyma]|uniref:Uncharacterized protein n=1 Tax=Podospora didyma TaxID=330526 RepID=A0AAE0NSB6_9PEZI|nr:hypothetical protein B0H63DRAFT_140781 [Podospora didyma]